MSNNLINYIENSRFYKLFYEGKEIPGYSTDMDGNIWKMVEEDGVITPIMHQMHNRYSNSYKSLHIEGENGDRTIKTHRAICETFHGRSEGDRILVNHIDGNKWNNHPNNLEWSSYSENNDHAYQTGLRSDNKDVKVLDLVENSLKVFASLTDAARYFGINQALMHHWLNGKSKRKVQQGRYLVAYVTEDFPEYDKSEIGSRNKYEPKPVKVTNLETNEVKYTANTVSAAIYAKLDIKPNSLRVALERGNGKTEYGNFVFEYLPDDFNRNEVEMINLATRKKRVLDKPIRPPVPIRVENLLTGVIKEYPSTQAFADELRVNKNTVQKLAGKYNGRYRNYIITYLR